MAGITERTPLVVFGDDWRRHVSTLQHLFVHAVGQRPVVWVNSFGHRVPRLTVRDVRRAAEKLRSMLAGYNAPADGGLAPARIIAPRVLPWHNIAAIYSLNTWSLLRDIRAALEEVAPGEPPLLVTGTPVAAGVVGSLGEIASFYFCIDDYAELPGVDRKIVAPLEQQILGKVDAVVATAQALVKLKRPASGLAYQLPQGVNYEHFATPRPTPPDLAQLPRPWIGFAGGVSSACDFELIRMLAEQHPNGSVVLIGPVEPGVSVPELSNIHLLGPRPYDILPAYVQAFDVGIIPYVLNDWTRSVDPLKLLEYLAAGIPVVTTALPEASKYASAVSIAADNSAFAGQVRTAIEARDRSDERERRRAVAREHTWAGRCQRFMAIAAEVVESRRSTAVSIRVASG
jgi:hypothetical protein